MELLQAPHGDDEVSLGCSLSDLFLESVEGDKHFGKRLFKNGEQELKAVVEVHVDRAFGARNSIGDGARSDIGQTLLNQ